MCRDQVQLICDKIGSGNQHCSMEEWLWIFLTDAKLQNCIDPSGWVGEVLPDNFGCVTWHVLKYPVPMHIGSLGCWTLNCIADTLHTARKINDLTMERCLERLTRVDKEVPCAVRVHMNVTTKTLYLSFWTETFVWEDQAKGTRKTKRTRDSLDSDVVSPRLKTLLSSPTKVFLQKTGSSSQQLNLKTLKSDSVQYQPLTTKIVILKCNTPPSKQAN